MAKKSEKNSIIEICPIRNVVARFGNKWALLVILILSENGSTRFNQLGKLIPDISTKMLAGTLHTLEADGQASALSVRCSLEYSSSASRPHSGACSSSPR